MEKQLIQKNITQNAEETYQLGVEFGKSLIGGETILMYGEAGAGKTVFTKGIGESLDINEVITSPTFALKNGYQGKIFLHHLDMYRIENEEDAFESGALDDISNENDITIVEWAENVEGFFDFDHIRLEIKYLTANSREISIYKVKL